jgi:hypothetical protein
MPSSTWWARAHPGLSTDTPTGGIYVSSDLRPFAQNLALPFATLVGRRPRRRVVFPLPIETPEIPEHLRSRLESGASGRSSTARIHSRTSSRPITEAHRYVESDQKVGKVVIDVRTD